MIFGCGIDIQEINTIKNIIEKYGERFLTKIYTPGEISYCKRKANYHSYAARWAVKEALFKALGTGIRKKSQFKEAEVVLDPQGKPEISVTGATEEFIQKENLSICVSISHSGNYVVGQVILFFK
ncbi:holo-ACP synthase [Bacillus sp. 166amftsu]|uniref:holo-ACP synthase n=1 Tax=Bacillus sp. 166amftsu TaxID=1761753 RepID=UPI00089B5A7D|nr:holo-ACP synthase [Bacillus sp. 166amftsu]SDZ37764.1 holo-[acyl-carrier-protein] synthase [Bacillus sp. 166amftsu]